MKEDFTKVIRTIHKEEQDTTSPKQKPLLHSIQEKAKSIFDTLSTKATSITRPHTYIAELEKTLQAKDKQLGKLKNQLDSEKTYGLFLESILKQAPNTVFIRDEDGKFLWVNNKYEEIAGLPASEIIDTDGSAYLGNQNDDIRRKRQTENDSILQTGIPVTGSPQKIMLQGVERWIETTKIRVQIPGTQEYLLVGYGNDVTEREDAKSTLENQNKDLVLSRNAEVEKTKKATQLAIALEDLRKSNTLLTETYKNKLISLDITLRTIIHDIRTPIGSAFSLLSLLQDQEQELFHSEEVVHSPTLQPDKQKKFLDKQHHYISLVLNSLENVLQLIRIHHFLIGFFELKNLKSLDDEFYIKTQTHVLIEECIREMDHFKIKKNKPDLIIDNTIHEQDNTATELWMAKHLIQTTIINNLLTNAIKFTSTEKDATGKILKQGRITVSGNIIDTPVENGLMRELRVSDNGCGIKEENIENIFTYGGQTEEGKAAMGMGLGLDSVKKLVHILGGSIKVESTYGEGSCFIVQLPCYFKQPETKDISKHLHEKSLEKNLEKLKDKRVLIVDDTKDNRTMLAEHLTTYGALPDFASNSINALSILEHQHTHYDIIFMDIQLGPGLDGYELTEAIRQIKGYQQTPIIGITAGMNQKQDHKRENYGMQGFTTKPINMNEIAYILKDITV